MKADQDLTRFGRPLEYAAKALVRVEFYTGTMHVSGDVEVNRWRVADVLNDTTNPFVLMQTAVREPLPLPGQPPQTELARAAAYLQVGKRLIIFAIPQDAPDQEVARQQYLAALLAERSHIVATAIISPFEVRGTMHMRRISTLRQALEDLPAQFIPMTHVEASYLPDPRLRVTADIAVVNRALAEVFSLSTEGAREAGGGFRRT